MPAELGQRLLAGDRGALSQAITLAVCTRGDHREAAEALLAALLPARRAAKVEPMRALRTE